jgi:hypothetical protein
MQQFIPFEDQWDELAALAPCQADPGCAVLAPLPVAQGPVNCRGGRFEGEDLFAGWPEAA